MPLARYAMSSDRIALDINVNGEKVSGIAESRTLLSDFLRHAVGMTGVHVGCEHGVCGACTILLDGKPVRSCLMFAVQADGAHLRTVEGLADGDTLHPMQQAFWDNHGLQCGFCTPGFLMLAVGVIEQNPDITQAEL